MDILTRLRGLISSSKSFTMLEIGAYDGGHTRQFLHLLENTRRPFLLHAFEPVPENFAKLLAVKSQGKGLGEFWVHDCAIGATNGEVPFYVSGPPKNYPASSSLRPPTAACSKRWAGMRFASSSACVRTLDDFAAEYLKGAPIDFIWADVQGAEIDLIRGGAGAFKRTRYFYTEYYNTEYYKGEIGLPGIRSLLPDFDVVQDYGEDVLLKNRAIA